MRVSTEKQHIGNQREEIGRFAERHGLTVDRWVTETASGRKSNRERKLGRVLKRLRRGDTLIVTELSRLSRTLTEIMSIMEQCLRRDIRLFSTKEGYAFDDSINSKVLCFAFGLVAEIERSLISMRTKEALAARRADGVTLGRRKGSCVKQRLLHERRDAVTALLREGAPLIEICRSSTCRPRRSIASARLTAKSTVSTAPACAPATDAPRPVNIPGKACTKKGTGRPQGQPVPVRNRRGMDYRVQPAVQSSDAETAPL